MTMDPNEGQPLIIPAMHQYQQLVNQDSMTSTQGFTAKPMNEELFLSNRLAEFVYDHQSQDKETPMEAQSRMAGVGLYTGQPHGVDEGNNWLDLLFDGNRPVCHYTFFPAVMAQPAWRNGNRNPDYGKKIVMMYAVLLVSDPVLLDKHLSPQESFKPFKTDDGGLIQVSTRFFGGSDAMFAIGGAINMSGIGRAQNAAKRDLYLVIQPFISQDSYSHFESEFGFPAMVANGNSMGIATFACCRGLNSMLYTGYLQTAYLDPGQGHGYPFAMNYPRTATQRDTARANRVAFYEPVMGFNYVESVREIFFKVALSAYTQFPIIIPASTQYKQSLEHVLSRDLVGQLFQIGRLKATMYSVQKMQDGVPYLGINVPQTPASAALILVANTTGDVSILSALVGYTFLIKNLPRYQGFQHDPTQQHIANELYRFNKEDTKTKHEIRSVIKQKNKQKTAAENAERKKRTEKGKAKRKQAKKEGPKGSALVQERLEKGDPAVGYPALAAMRVWDDKLNAQPQDARTHQQMYLRSINEPYPETYGSLEKGYISEEQALARQQAWREATGLEPRSQTALQEAGQTLQLRYQYTARARPPAPVKLRRANQSGTSTQSAAPPRPRQPVPPSQPPPQLQEFDEDEPPPNPDEFNVTAPTVLSPPPTRAPSTAVVRSRRGVQAQEENAAVGSDVTTRTKRHRGEEEETRAAPSPKLPPPPARGSADYQKFLEL